MYREESGCSNEAKQCSYLNDEINSLVELDGRVVDSVSVSRCLSKKRLTVRGLVARSFLIDESRFSDGIIFDSCQIDVLDIRFPRQIHPPSVTLINCRLGDGLFRRISDLVLSHCQAKRDLRCEDVHCIDVSSLRSFNFELSMTEKVQDAQIVVDNVRLEDRFSISGYQLERCCIKNAKVSEVRIERTGCQELVISELVCSEKLVASMGESLISKLKAENLRSPEVVLNAPVQSFKLLPVCVSGFSSIKTLRSGLRLKVELVGATWISVLQLYNDGHGSFVSICEEVNVERLSLAREQFTSIGQLSRFVREVFGDESARSYALMARSIVDDGKGSDLAYYMTMKRATRASAWSRAYGIFATFCLGWGVRLLPPIVSLFVMYVSSVCLLWWMAPATASIFELFVAAAGSWFALGTWVAPWASTPELSLFSVVVGLLGLMYVTLIIGIGIRRLVR